MSERGISFGVSSRFLFGELEPRERVRTAAEAGFLFFDCWSFKEEAPDFSQWVLDEGMYIHAIFGHPGIALVQAGWEGVLRRTLDEAVRAQVRNMFVFAQHVAVSPDGSKKAVPDFNRGRGYPEQLVTNLRRACELVEGSSVGLILEPLNGVNIEKSWCRTAQHGAEIVRRVGNPRLTLAFDTYHEALALSDLQSAFQVTQDVVGPVHLAEIPDRTEPGTGEGLAACFARQLPRLGYSGPITLECVPSHNLSIALARIAELREDILRCSARGENER